MHSPHSCICPRHVARSGRAAQERLVAAVNRIYLAQLADSQRATQQLHELSVASGKMLLMYQMRPYGGMVNYPGFLLSDDVMAAIDADILAGLAAVRRASPESALEVEALQRNYEFIRPRIFDAQKRFVAHGVNH